MSACVDADVEKDCERWCFLVGLVKEVDVGEALEFGVYTGRDPTDEFEGKLPSFEGLSHLKDDGIVRIEVGERKLETN